MGTVKQSAPGLMSCTEVVSDPVPPHLEALGPTIEFCKVWVVDLMMDLPVGGIEGNNRDKIISHQGPVHEWLLPRVKKLLGHKVGHGVAVVVVVHVAQDILQKERSHHVQAMVVQEESEILVPPAAIEFEVSFVLGC